MVTPGTTDSIGAHWGSTASKGQGFGLRENGNVFPLFQPRTCLFWSPPVYKLVPGQGGAAKGWHGRRAFKHFRISTQFLSRPLREKPHLLAERRKLKIGLSCHVFQGEWTLPSWTLV